MLINPTQRRLLLYIKSRAPRGGRGRQKRDGRGSNKQQERAVATFGSVLQDLDEVKRHEGIAICLIKLVLKLDPVETQGV